MSELPPGWAQATTDTLFTFVTSGSRGWARYYSDEGAPFIRIGNLQRGSITPYLDDLQRVSPPEGVEGTRTQVAANDILVSITADLGRIALVEDVKETTYINQHVALARPVQTINPRYLAWYLSSDVAQQQWGKQQRGVTRLGLGLENIRSVEVPIAPLAEQARIVAAIEEQFSRLDAGVAALRRAKRNLQRARAAVLEQLAWADMDGSRQALALGSLIDDVRTGLDRGRVRQRTQPPGYGYVKMADVRDGIVDLSAISYVDASPDEVAVCELRDGDILFNNRNSRELVGKSGLVVSPPTGTLYNNN